MKWWNWFVVAGIFLSSNSIPVQAQSTCLGPTYTILEGESLYSIAEKCRIPYKGLVGINVEISNPDLIRPGQVIRLVASAPLYTSPASGQAQEGGLQEDGSEYIVRPGDSLARIAYLYQTSVADLAQINSIEIEKLVYPGQRLKMPPDARKEKGWAGVSTLVASPGGTFELRLVDFPAYAAVEIRLGEVYNNVMTIYVRLDGTVDAKGQARINIKLPSYAWYDEEWIVEVVTTDLVNPARAVTPVILID